MGGPDYLVVKIADLNRDFNHDLNQLIFLSKNHDLNHIYFRIFHIYNQGNETLINCCLLTFARQECNRNSRSMVAILFM